MNSYIYVPCSARLAAYAIRLALPETLNNLPKESFVTAWSSIAYLYPGLHPDGYDDPDSGWPRVLRRFAAEAWARAESGELADDELYPCEAQWCGIFDRMTRAPSAAEVEHRTLSAALHGVPA